MINKKNLALFAATIALTCVPVFADGLIFEPDSYPVSTAEAQTTSPYATAPVSTKNVTDITNQVTRENNNMQDALFKLDSAQTDLRNQLLEDRAKYTEIDNKFKATKEQRKIQKQLVRDGERKINQIEKNKKQIRKLMQIQQ
ncbi:MAG: hypothetical protein K6C94_02740 [Candidatus Gastranaerophilales bacterium]|nr:hypothetical protein [Candidatus Gastranaerophilales bacterium]